MAGSGVASQIEFVGVDGCPAGWFSVGFDCSGSYETKTFGDFTELLAHYRGASLVLVDIPIGLPEGPGGRECDREARKLLGKRRSSVFPVPSRRTVHQAAESPADYGHAAEVERHVAGQGISKQAFAIAPKIAEVDRLLATCGENAAPRVREVHPEVCFWTLNGRQPMECNKRKAEGREERLRALQAVEPQAQQIFDEACRKCFRRDVAKDDILDALVAAVTAREGLKGLLTIPCDPPSDSKGLPMEMVYLGQR